MLKFSALKALRLAHRSSLRGMRVISGAIVLVALAAGVAACGSSSKSEAAKTSAKSSSAKVAESASTSSSSASSSSAAASPVSGEPESAVKEAEKEGEKAAEIAGPAPKVPSETIGVLDVTGESEAARRIEAGAAEAAKAIGWKMVSIDAEGNPTKEEAGMMTFVNEKVSAILDLSNVTAAIAQGLSAARAQNIPVIVIGGLEEPSPGIEAQFVPNDIELTEHLDAYMIEHLKPGAQLATFVYPALLVLRNRDETLKRQLSPHVKIVVSHTENFEALVSDTEDTARTIISTYPQIAAFWADNDVDLPAIAHVLKSKGLCGKVQVYDYYDDLPNLAAIREGCATAVANGAVSSDGWGAVDALAEMFARKQPITSLPQKGWETFEKKYGVEIQNGSSIQVIDKSNLPPEGQYVPPKVDYVAFFETKWKKEFGH